MNELLKSIRAVATLIICLTYAALALMGKVEHDNVVTVTILVLNYYFLQKKRLDEEKKGDERK